MPKHYQLTKNKMSEPTYIREIDQGHFFYYQIISKIELDSKNIANTISKELEWLGQRELPPEPTEPKEPNSKSPKKLAQYEQDMESYRGQVKKYSNYKEQWEKWQEDIARKNVELEDYKIRIEKIEKIRKALEKELIPELYS